MSILVTGGTKGIGLAIAQRFAKPGALVFLNFHADTAAADAAQSLIESTGARCVIIKGDVGTPEGARDVIARVAAHTDRLDQLVHCAVRVLPASMLEVDLDAFTAAINLNGTSLVYLVQAAKDLLRRGSSVFFLSSRGSRLPVPRYAAVGAAKSLGESLVRYLATELAPRGVRINTVSPGTVETDALRQVYGEETQAKVREAAATNPSGRNVEPNDFCSLIEFLAGPGGEMIQGQAIFVNGGAYLSA